MVSGTNLPNESRNPVVIHVGDSRHAPDSLVDASGRIPTIRQEANLVTSPNRAAREVDSLWDVSLEVESVCSALAENFVFARKISCELRVLALDLPQQLCQP
jgi:hypothetical protein